MPRLYDVEEDGEYLYLVEEYLEGVHPTEAFLRNNRLTERSLVQIAGELSAFLRFLRDRENPVLYLDWKPENIILAENRVKVIDFGSAIHLGEEEEIKLATDDYSAEELKTGGQVGTYTDIFGFGCLLNMLSNHTLKSKRGWFQKGTREKMIALSKRCMKSNREQRCSLKEIEKDVRQAKKKVLKTKEDFCKGNIELKSQERVIGICGAFKGAGSSHIAVLIAQKLANSAKKVAFVDFTKGANSSEFLTQVKELSRNITVFSDVETEKMISILGENFQHIIIDFGIFRERILLEYLRCDKKFLVVQNSFSKKAYIKTFLQKNQSFLNGKNIHFLLNMSTGEEAESMKREMEKKRMEVSVVWQEFEPIKNK